MHGTAIFGARRGDTCVLTNMLTELWAELLCNLLDYLLIVLICLAAKIYPGVWELPPHRFSLPIGPLYNLL